MLYLAIGRRELGKTTLVYKLARAVPQRIVFDPRRMIEARDAIVVTTPAAVGPAVLELWKDPDQAEVVVTPRDDPQGCFVALCEAVRDWIERDPRIPLAVVLDEMRFVSTIGQPAFDFMLRCAPRDVVHVFMTCHRPKDVPVDVRAIMDQWLLFGATQRHDLAEIQAFAGPETVTIVQALKPFEWVQWDDARGKMTVHRSPTRWYVPLREVETIEDVDPLAGMTGLDPEAKGRLFG